MAIEKLEVVLKPSRVHSDPTDRPKLKSRRDPSSFFVTQLSADHKCSYYFEMISAVEKQCCICTESNLDSKLKKALLFV